MFSQGHIKNALHEKGKNPRWHGLTKYILLSIPEQLENLAIIMDSLNADDSIIVVTDKTDNDKLPIIATLKLNGVGQYQLEEISFNYLTSVYGRKNFVNYVNRAIQENKLLYINKNKIQALDSSSNPQLVGNLSNLEFNTIIHKSHVKIKAEEKEIEKLKSVSDNDMAINVANNFFIILPPFVKFLEIFKISFFVKRFLHYYNI